MSETSTNTDALNNMMYNPEYDDTDLSIYNTITNNMSSDTYNKVLAQYTATWYSLPSVNQYEGVLMNPVACDGNDITSDTSDIINSINGWGLSSDDPFYSSISDPTNSNSIISSITGGNSTTTSVNADDILSVPTDAIITSNGDGTYSATSYTNPTAVNPSVSFTNNYINTIISNLPMMLGIAQGAMGLATSLDKLSNPCINIGNFFGTIKTTAAAVFAKIKSWISKLKSYINAGLDAVKAALEEINKLIQDIMSEINDLISSIKKEISKFIKSMIDSIKLGLSGFLKGLKLDPCASYLVKSLATPAAQFAL